MSSTARDLAGAAIGLGVFGVGPVAALIVADEVEHFRCGIGCVLVKIDESGKFVVERTIAHKISEASNDDVEGRLDVGDTILRVDDTWLHAQHTLQEVTSLIRGKEGTFVRLLVIKKDDNLPALISIARRRLAGSKTEMLGALWQVRFPKIMDSCLRVMSAYSVEYSIEAVSSPGRKTIFPGSMTQ